MIDIKQLVKDGKKVTFLHYKEGELWYRSEDGFEFPVPTGDAGSATLLAQDKALLFMRWMRRHAQMLEQARSEQSVG